MICKFRATVASFREGCIPSQDWTIPEQSDRNKRSPKIQGERETEKVKARNKEGAAE